MGLSEGRIVPGAMRGGSQNLSSVVESRGAMAGKSREKEKEISHR
jgi:hypothetical protein